jgi:predicted MPP superfamily phosphohydrolase
MEPADHPWRARPRPSLKAVAHTIASSAMARAAVALVTRLAPPPRVRLSRHEIVLPRLPARLDGLRVLHVTDLHLHPGPRLAWQIPALARTTPHDLICYTGDFIDSDADLPRLVDLLAHMPRGVPAYAVLGNHDYKPYGRWYGHNNVQRLRQVLTAAGLTILSNESRLLYGGGLSLVGVDDPATRHDDLDRAFAQVPAAAGSLLLAHSPDIVLRLANHHPGLILAGHTHGGQVRLPLLGAVLTESHIPRRLAMGLHAYNGTQLFVSRGVGYSGLDLRFACPSEVTLLTLRSPSVAPDGRLTDA